MALHYLWVHRSRPAVASRPWLKTWAKRVYNAHALLRFMLRTSRLRRAGATIGNVTVINAQFLGPKANFRCGDGCAIGTAKITLHAPVVVGNNVAINDCVTILTASHDLADPEWQTFAKEIHIDDYAWIAEGATLLPGVHIGRGAVVGTQAVVTRDVEPFAVVVGNPAKPTSTKRTTDLRYQPSAFFACFEAWMGAPSTTTAQARAQAIAATRGTS